MFQSLTRVTLAVLDGLILTRPCLAKRAFEGVKLLSPTRFMCHIDAACDRRASSIPARRRIARITLAKPGSAAADGRSISRASRSRSGLASPNRARCSSASSSITAWPCRRASRSCCASDSASCIASSDVIATPVVATAASAEPALSALTRKDTSPGPRRVGVVPVAARDTPPTTIFAPFTRSGRHFLPSQEPTRPANLGPARGTPFAWPQP
jgi:hypothetical protein